jgi:[acyl-carrier-protein] S-malonyltransferase
MTTPLVAYLFPGQGAHEPAMLDTVRDCPQFAERIAIASDRLGLDLEDELATRGQAFCNGNAVSSVLTVLVSCLLLDRLDTICPVRPAFLAGYSVGQWTAMYAAGCVSFAQLVEIIVARARLMDESLSGTSTGMLGVIGVAESDLRCLCNEMTREGELLVISNFNAAGQYSLAGSLAAIDHAAERLICQGAKRVVRLPVGGAWHSPLLFRAAQRLEGYLEQVELCHPKIAVADNVTGKLLPSSIPLLRCQLALHLCSPVRWSACIKTLRSAGCGSFIEVGHGNMLSKFGFFIDRTARFMSCSDRSLVPGGA